MSHAAAEAREMASMLLEVEQPNFLQESQNMITDMAKRRSHGLFSSAIHSEMTAKIFKK